MTNDRLSLRLAIEAALHSHALNLGSLFVVYYCYMVVVFHYFVSSVRRYLGTYRVAFSNGYIVFGYNSTFCPVVLRI